MCQRSKMYVPYVLEFYDIDKNLIYAYAIECARAKTCTTKSNDKPEKRQNIKPQIVINYMNRSHTSKFDDFSAFFIILRRSTWVCVCVCFLLFGGSAVSQQQRQQSFGVTHTMYNTFFLAKAHKLSNDRYSLVSILHSYSTYESWIYSFCTLVLA